MRILELPKQGGKTTYLLRLLLCNPENILITHSESEAERLREIFEESKGMADRIFSFEAAKNLFGHRFKRAYVDNVDLILQNMFRMPIDYVTVTETVHENKSQKKE
jgi:hypothetical protein